MFKSSIQITTIKIFSTPNLYVLQCLIWFHNYQVKKLRWLICLNFTNLKAQSILAKNILVDFFTNK
jgi:hypothetical protein